MPSPPKLPLRGLPSLAVTTVDFGRGALGVLSPCEGELFALSTREVRADERGVTLPFASTLLTGVFGPLTLGVGGSDLAVDAGLGVIDFEGGVALAATRGVRGVRGVRFDARVGLSGRFGLLDRSVDIIVLPLLDYSKWSDRLSLVSCLQCVRIGC